MTMRIKNVIVTGALLLASSGLALAQQAQLAQSAQQGQTDVVQTQGPFVGTLDLSFRASDMTGDVARFQRYRDIRDQGAGLNLKFKRDAGTWVFNLGAKNVGYEDQNFTALFRSGKAKASLEWNQVPLFYGASDMLRTPYSTQISNGVATLSLPAGTQAAVQNSGAVGVALNVAQLG
ncbi:MAG: hypothetical protein HYX76_14610, partial [Acidobacteria bacterium]|nr:hypothetical protein [Acidobacteriota bacterium]